MRIEPIGVGIIAADYVYPIAGTARVSRRTGVRGPVDVEPPRQDDVESDTTRFVLASIWHRDYESNAGTVDQDGRYAFSSAVLKYIMAHVEKQRGIVSKLKKICDKFKRGLLRETDMSSSRQGIIFYFDRDPELKDKDSMIAWSAGHLNIKLQTLDGMDRKKRSFMTELVQAITSDQSITLEKSAVWETCFRFRSCVSLAWIDDDTFAAASNRGILAWSLTRSEPLWRWRSEEDIGLIVARPNGGGLLISGSRDPNDLFQALTSSGQEMSDSDGLERARSEMATILRMRESLPADPHPDPEARVRDRRVAAINRAEGLRVFTGENIRDYARNEPGEEAPRESEIRIFMGESRIADFSDDGNRLVFIGIAEERNRAHVCRIYLWEQNAGNRTMLHVITGCGAEQRLQKIRTMSVSPSGRYVVIAGDEDYLGLFNLDERDEVRSTIRNYPAICDVVSKWAGKAVVAEVGGSADELRRFQPQDSGGESAQLCHGEDHSFFGWMEDGSDPVDLDSMRNTNKDGFVACGLKFNSWNERTIVVEKMIMRGALPDALWLYETPGVLISYAACPVSDRMVLLIGIGGSWRIECISRSRGELIARYDWASRRDAFEAYSTDEDSFHYEDDDVVNPRITAMAGDMIIVDETDQYRRFQICRNGRIRDRGPISLPSNCPSICITVSPDGSRFFLASADGTVWILDAVTGAPEDGFIADKNENITAMACSVKGLYVAQADGSLYRFSVFPGRA